jgi:hypothetical protein
MGNVVEVRHLTRPYRIVTAVDHVSFSIEANQVYGLLGRSGTGENIFFGIAFLLLSAFVLVSVYGNWQGAIVGWLAHQTATGLVTWLVPLIAFFALASYALLRKATV